MSSSFASASNSLASKTNASSSSSIATSLADKKAPFQELSADMKQSLWSSLLLFKNAFDERDMEDLPPQLVEEFLVAVCQLFRALGQYNSLSSAVQHDACYHVIQEDGITTLVPSNGMLAAMMWTTITTCSHGSSFFRRLLSKYFSSKCFELSPNTGGNTGTSENGFMHYLLNIGINKSYLESTRHLSLQLAGATARDANSINPTVRIALSQLVASHLQQLIHNSQGMMDKSVFFMFVALAALTNAANPVHFESHGPHPTVTNPHMKLMSMHDLLLWAFEKYGNSDEFLTLFYRMLALLSERNATLLTDKLMNSLLESLLEGQEVSSTSLHRSYRQFLGCLTLRQVLQQSEKAKASSKAFVMSTLASLRQEVAVKMAANPNKQRHHEEANEQDKTIDVRAYMSPSKHEEQEFATLTLNEIDFIQVILTK